MRQRPPGRRPPAGQEGFALVAVLLVVALLGVVGGEFAYSMRLEATAVRAYKDGIVAAHLAEAAVEQAIREIVADVAYAILAEDGDLTFFSRESAPLPRLPRARVPLGSGQFSYRLTDEESRINLNAASPDRIDRLLRTLEVSKNERDVIVDSIQDWKDANEEHRLNGAESDDTYLRRPVPYRSRNGNLESITELLQIKGVTPALYHGAEGRPGLADLVSVRTPGTVNLNTAPSLVLRTLGLSDAEIGEIVQKRREGPYTDLGRFGGRGLAVRTRTFRIEAEGLIDGRPRATITAVVQRRMDRGNPSVVVMEWSGIR